MNFDSLGAFAAHLLTLQASEAVALHRGLERVAEAVEQSAKAEVGFYQPRVGPFDAWDPLADSTEQEKARLGYEPDAPLLRKGDLRDSYGHQVTALEAIIGSPLMEAVWQELGTPTIPPRAVLGPAALHNKERIERILGAAAVEGLLGGEAIHRTLGYAFDTLG